MQCVFCRKDLVFAAGYALYASQHATHEPGVCHIYLELGLGMYKPNQPFRCVKAGGFVY